MNRCFGCWMDLEELEGQLISPEEEGWDPSDAWDRLMENLEYRETCAFNNHTKKDLGK